MRMLALMSITNLPDEILRLIIYKIPPRADWPARYVAITRVWAHIAQSAPAYVFRLTTPFTICNILNSPLAELWLIDAAETELARLQARGCNRAADSTVASTVAGTNKDVYFAIAILMQQQRRLHHVTLSAIQQLVDIIAGTDAGTGASISIDTNTIALAQNALTSEQFALLRGSKCLYTMDKNITKLDLKCALIGGSTIIEDYPDCDMGKCILEFLYKWQVRAPHRPFTSVYYKYKYFTITSPPLPPNILTWCILDKPRYLTAQSARAISAHKQEHSARECPIRAHLECIISGSQSALCNAENVSASNSICTCNNTCDCTSGLTQDDIMHMLMENEVDAILYINEQRQLRISAMALTSCTLMRNTALVISVGDAFNYAFARLCDHRAKCVHAQCRAWLTAALDNTDGNKYTLHGARLPIRPPESVSILDEVNYIKNYNGADVLDQ